MKQITTKKMALLSELYPKYKRLIKESFTRKTAKKSTQEVTLKADAQIIDISDYIANLIRNNCAEHPKILKFDKEKNKQVYERDPLTNEVLVDTTKTVYSLYYNLYPIIGIELNMSCDSCYDKYDYYNEYADKMYIQFKETKKGPVLSVVVSRAQDRSYYGNVNKKVSEILVPSNLVPLFQNKKSFNKFEEPELIPLYARVLGGIFMKYGDTISKKKDYKENPTDLNLSNINRKILPENFDLTECKERFAKKLETKK